MVVGGKCFLYLCIDGDTFCPMAMSSSNLQLQEFSNCQQHSIVMFTNGPIIGSTEKFGSTVAFSIMFALAMMPASHVKCTHNVWLSFFDFLALFSFWDID